MKSRSSFNNKDLLDKLFSFEETITNLDLNKKLSTDKQLRIFQDLQDIILEINRSRILEEYFIRLEISPRHRWNDRGINTRIFDNTTKIEDRSSCSFWMYEIISQRKILNYEHINILTETGDSIYSPEHESNKLEFGPRRGKLFISLDKLKRL
jgi:hypothetical protein